MHYQLLAYQITERINNPVLQDRLGTAKNNQASGSQLAILMARLYRISVVVGGLALLLYFAWGGVNWITAGGDQQKVEAARSRILNAVVGMAVLVSTLAVAELLSNEHLFGFDLLNPTFKFD